MVRAGALTVPFILCLVKPGAMRRRSSALDRRRVDTERTEARQAGIGDIVSPHERHLALGQRRTGQKPADRGKRIPQREGDRQQRAAATDVTHDELEQRTIA